jgi:hypothetical protein
MAGRLAGAIVKVGWQDKASAGLKYITANPFDSGATFA